MDFIAELKKKYPQAQAWSIGDNPAMANALADLVIKRIKTASCGSLAAFQSDEFAPKIGSYNIILNGQGAPACVIRMVSMRLVRFLTLLKSLPGKKVKAI
jgi:uncharacterized protein YhfF